MYNAISLVYRRRTTTLQALINPISESNGPQADDFGDIYVVM